jgi:hypothetical protein
MFDPDIYVSQLGIDLGVIAQKLQDDGVDAFAKSFESVSACIASKREQLQRSMTRKRGLRKESDGCCKTQAASC